jgi:phosphatidylinositol alpha-1,6-mannosyltransferase
MNHLVLSEEYLPLKGGHIVLLHELGRRLGGDCVLSARLDGSPDQETIDGVEVERISLARSRFLRPESLALYVNFFRSAGRRIKRSRPRAVIAARALAEGLVANALAWRFGVPSIVLAHGEEISPWTHDAPRPRRRRVTAALKRSALWHTYRQAGLIVANSRFTSDLLTDGGIDPEHVRIVHPGTDPERYRPMPKDAALRAELGLAGKKIVLTVGRLMWRKGQDMMLQAMPAILREEPDVMYVMVGRGDYEPGLRDLTRTLGLESHVRMLGEVPFAQLPALYNLADVFVMPNRVSAESRDLEGFGIVFLEANACEVPVIGGRSGGTCDAIAEGETGLLVDGTQPPEIAGAVLRLLKNPGEARQMGVAGRARVLREFTWDHAARRLETLIEGLQPGRGAREGGR